MVASWCCTHQIYKNFSGCSVLIAMNTKLYSDVFPCLSEYPSLFQSMLGLPWSLPVYVGWLGLSQSMLVSWVSLGLSQSVLAGWVSPSLWVSLGLSQSMLVLLTFPPLNSGIDILQEKLPVRKLWERSWKTFTRRCCQTRSEKQTEEN